MNIIAKTFKTALYIVTLICLTHVYQLVAFGAGQVDPGFNSAPSLAFNSLLSSKSVTFQPDGKIIIFGAFEVVSGVVRNQIARLNTDGTLDTSFNCQACDSAIYSALVQPDGKIIVAGTVIRRLNPDGSVDTSFTSPFTPGNGVTTYSSQQVWALQPDGKIIVTNNSQNSGYSQTSVYRLNPDGTLDSTFTTISFQPGRLIYQYVTKVKLAPDGKIIASGGSGGTQSQGFLNRFNSDGTRDMTFEPPTLVNSPAPSTIINDFDVQADGSIFFVGTFTTVNGVARVGIAKLLSAGNVDSSFVPADVSGINVNGYQVKVLPNGKVIVNVNNSMLIRFNANGSVDSTFNQAGNLAGLQSFALDETGRIVLFGLFNENGSMVYRYGRLSSDGNLDTSFNPSVEAAGSISLIASQPNGKIIVGGNFSRINGLPRNRVARLNSDGTTDASFDAGSGFTGNIYKIAVQADGKILVAGALSNAGHVNLVRLNADGSLDNTFNPVFELNNSLINTVALQADGKILVGGFFTTVNGTSRTSVARLNPDGSVDAGFNVTLGTNTNIRSILVQTDGNILIGGTFSGVNGFSRTNLARLNSDGSLDTAFNPGNIAPVYQIEVQPDGKYLALTNTLIRLNNNGTVDSSFQTQTFSSGNISSFALQADGSVIIGGDFASGFGSLRLARLKADGSLDLSFISSGANNTVRIVVKQPDGRILIGGDFTRVANATRLGIARLTDTLNTTRTAFDFDGDGKADISVFRPSSSVWYRINSSNNSVFTRVFGSSTDLIAPADYDGDGRTDLAFFRPAPGLESAFSILDSSTNTIRQITFASIGDVPVTGDWDGDGKADAAIYRAATASGGQSYFYYRPTASPGVNFIAVPWGTMGDNPIAGDFDGDGKQDAAVYRPSTGEWYILNSSNNQFRYAKWGTAGDIAIAADYDGEGRADIAIYRPSSGEWYILPTGTTNQYRYFKWGIAEDVPVPADYDGDGRADVAVWRPSSGVWYLLQSTNGFTGVQCGASGDKPVESAYIY